MLYRAFGPNAQVRHKMFKCFLACQDPALPIPARKEQPLHKVEPLIAQVNLAGAQAWQLGRDLGGDEQSIGFQGNHPDKLRVTYKKEGDGFQGDAIGEDGYTHGVYMRNLILNSVGKRGSLANTINKSM